MVLNLKVNKDTPGYDLTELNEYLEKGYTISNHYRINDQTVTIEKYENTKSEVKMEITNG